MSGWGKATQTDIKLGLKEFLCKSRPNKELTVESPVQLLTVLSSYVPFLGNRKIILVYFIRPS
jgi:hypothetical protein